MKSLTPEIAEKEMNALGKNREAFLAIINYDKSITHIIPLNRMTDSDCLFSYPDSPSLKAGNYSENPQLSFEPPAYQVFKSAFQRLQKHIKRGDTYLCNLSFETPITTSFSLKDLFHFSFAKYKVCIPGKFVCFSPESFIKIANKRVQTYPMKGTIEAGTPNARRKLLDDPKEKAEHHTIVDLLRNDISMIADQAEVSRFRYVDEIHTNRNRLLQTSSEITGILDDTWHEKIGSLLFKILPAGSITGAPKQKTMEIIRQIENHDRGYYTGVSCLYDGKSLDSFVMIRMIVEKQGQKFYKSGGGITSMSDIQSEYEELIQKIYVPLH